MEDHTEREIHLLDYWRILVKRRWVVYSFLALVPTIATLSSLLTRPLYTATTRLQIESSTPNVLPFQEVMASVPDQRNDFYQTQYGLIQSRRVAREVISRLRLENHPEFKADGGRGQGPGMAPEQVAEAKRIDIFLRKLKVTPVRNSRLVDVSFTSHDRALAARAANRLAETYIAFNSEARYNTSERATASIAHQIANLHEEVETREQKLQAYAREHGIIPLSEKQNITVKKLNDLSDAYTRSQAARIETEARFAALRDAEPAELPEVRENKLVQELGAKLAELDRRHAQLSEKYKPEWPEMVRLRREVDETRERVSSERRGIYEQVVGAAGAQYRKARNEEGYLRSAVEEMKRQSQDLSLKEIQYNNLKAEITSRRETLDALVKRRGETATAAGVNELATGNIRVVDMAEVPVKPSSPKILLNLLLSLVAGLGLGIGAAFFFDYLDKSVKTPEEMTEATGLPVLGLIPAERSGAPRLMLVHRGGARGFRLQVIRTLAPGAQNGQRIELVAHEEAKSGVSEAFRELRTALLVSQPGGPPKSILIASSHPGEGKTMVASNLAITLAQLGRRVLLVDADLRRPRVHKLFRIAAPEGLSNYLSGVGPLRTQPRPTTVPGLHVIPSGPLPPNPADLLDSDRFMQIQRDFDAQGYDHVVFDSPPILAVADPAIMAGRVQAVVLVVQAAVTSRDALSHAVDRLRQVKAHIVGGVLNQVDLSQQGYYGYSYKRYYGKDTDSPAPAAAGERRHPPGLIGQA